AGYRAFKGPGTSRVRGICLLDHRVGTPLGRIEPDRSTGLGEMKSAPLTVTKRRAAHSNLPRQRALRGSGQPKASPTWATPTGLRVGNSPDARRDLRTSAPVASARFARKIISSHRSWRKGNDCS